MPQFNGIMVQQDGYNGTLDGYTQHLIAYGARHTDSVNLADFHPFIGQL